MKKDTYSCHSLNFHLYCCPFLSLFFPSVVFLSVPSSPFLPLPSVLFFPVPFSPFLPLPSVLFLPVPFSPFLPFPSVPSFSFYYSPSKNLKPKKNMFWL